MRVLLAIAISVFLTYDNVIYCLLVITQNERKPLAINNAKNQLNFRRRQSSERPRQRRIPCNNELIIIT